MLDLQYICDNAEAVQKNCVNRGVDINIMRIVELRVHRGELISAGDEIRRHQKEIASQIPNATKDARPALIEQGKQLKLDVVESEETLKVVQAELDDLMLQVPNLTHPDAPLGGEDDATLLREVGEKPKFDFKALDHVDLMQKLDLVDFEAGAKVTGSGFYFLKNEAVLLELALIQYAIDILRREGFTIYTTPDLAREEIMAGTGYQPRGPETQIYSIDGTDLSLVATAEITLGGSLKDKIINEADLPIKMAGLSHCFRTEAGGAGKATRGIYRVHQFTKVEMFGFTAPDVVESDKFHQMVVRIEEELFSGLGIPYRVIDTAAGDLGGPAYRKFDLEAWMPGRGEAGEYGEVTSASNCTDFQARRLGIRTKIGDMKGTQFVHTLNGTAVAVTRAMIAVLENHQQADGSVVIPKVLRKWTGVDVITPKT